MRILIVSYVYEYPNNMYSEYLKSLSSVADVSYWGPGYSSSEELCKGLMEEWNSSYYDALLFDFDLINYKLENNIDHIFRYSNQNTKRVSIEDLYRFGNDIFIDALKIQGIKILHVTLDQFYLQSIEETWLQLMLENGFYLEWVGKEFFPDFEKNRVKLCGVYATNQGLRLVDKYFDHMISNPITAISKEEVCTLPISDRKYDWVLPGAMQRGIYDSRIKVFNIVKQMNINIYDQFEDREIRYDIDKSKNTKYTNKFAKYIDKKTNGSCPYIMRRISEEQKNNYRKRYDYSISQSKIVYVDGGNAGLIVHKFFEVPVRGAILMCEPFYGMEKLGFLDNKNMVITSGDDIKDKIQKLLENPEKMQKIANAGMKLVLEKHTYLERGKCLVECIKSIKNNKFKGTYWNRGEFIIVE